MRKLIAIDPGHGGRDPGAVGIVSESALTYPWAHAFRARLRQHGHFAELTHTEPEPGKKVSLSTRVLRAREMGAGLYVSVHANASESHRGTGAEIHVHHGWGTAFDLATVLLPPLTEGIGKHGAGIVLSPKLYVLRMTPCPALLLEIGYVDHPADATWLAANYLDQVIAVADKLAGAQQ